MCGGGDCVLLHEKEEVQQCCFGGRGGADGGLRPISGALLLIAGASDSVWRVAGGKSDAVVELGIAHIGMV